MSLNALTAKVHRKKKQEGQITFDCKQYETNGIIL